MLTKVISDKYFKILRKTRAEEALTKTPHINLMTPWRGCDPPYWEGLPFKGKKRNAFLANPLKGFVRPWRHWAALWEFTCLPILCCKFECESSNCQLPAQRFEVGLSACFSCTDAAQRDKTSCAIISTERLLSVFEGDVGWCETLTISVAVQLHFTSSNMEMCLTWDGVPEAAWNISAVLWPSQCLCTQKMLSDVKLTC